MFKNYNKTIFVLIGIQASGKTTFCQEYLSCFDVVSLDAVRTRKRENRIITETAKTGKSFVIDNTNPTIAERQKYIDFGHKEGYKVVGIYFSSSLDECLKRNAERENSISLKGILSTAKKLEQPNYTENFDELYYVKIKKHKFIISKWNEEL